MSKLDKAAYTRLLETPAFQELLEDMQRFKSPHLKADAPNTVLPNYSEVAADNAAQYRTITTIEKWLCQRSGLDSL